MGICPILDLILFYELYFYDDRSAVNDWIKVMRMKQTLERKWIMRFALGMFPLQRIFQKQSGNRLDIFVYGMCAYLVHSPFL
mmetsp:Transcript_28895/g.41972  ORF Transcript_28895/g.41972 Transcript_28895/m.41972 type:complete len:82 (-) Transcript_28895:18-263(-)